MDCTFCPRFLRPTNLLLLLPSSSSAIETDAGSPTSDRRHNSRQKELNPTPGDDEIGPNGRMKRKQKLTEQAAELQAEKGRKTAQFKVRVSTPKSKGDGQNSFPRNFQIEPESVEKEEPSQIEKVIEKAPQSVPEENSPPKFKLPKVKPSKPKLQLSGIRTKKPDTTWRLEETRMRKGIRRSPQLMQLTRFGLVSFQSPYCSQFTRTLVLSRHDWH